ncbi:hypothetical protein B0H13DRAFT_2346759 [Mycena leptocephala]|nr:hypothetical protein B0H13DRAFT_2346759 [Mycena leptocephala]
MAVDVTTFLCPPTTAFPRFTTLTGSRPAARRVVKPPLLAALQTLNTLGCRRHSSLAAIRHSHLPERLNRVPSSTRSSIPSGHFCPLHPPAPAASAVQRRRAVVCSIATDSLQQQQYEPSTWDSPAYSPIVHTHALVHYVHRPHSQSFQHSAASAQSGTGQAQTAPYPHARGVPPTPVASARGAAPAPARQDEVPVAVTPVVHVPAVPVRVCIRIAVGRNSKIDRPMCRTGGQEAVTVLLLCRKSSERTDINVIKNVLVSSSRGDDGEEVVIVTLRAHVHSAHHMGHHHSGSLLSAHDFTHAPQSIRPLAIIAPDDATTSVQFSADFFSHGQAHLKYTASTLWGLLHPQAGTPTAYRVHLHPPPIDDDPDGDAWHRITSSYGLYTAPSNDSPNAEVNEETYQPQLSSQLISPVNDCVLRY